MKDQVTQHLTSARLYVYVLVFADLSTSHLESPRIYREGPADSHTDGDNSRYFSRGSYTRENTTFTANILRHLPEYVGLALDGTRVT